MRPSMDERYIKYQSLSLQEAKAVEREVIEMIQYAFMLGRRTEAEIREVTYLQTVEPVTHSAH
jgi:hypothetical protein